MKAISFTFDNFNFIVYPFQSARMYRELAMGYDAVSMSFKGLGKSNNRPHIAFLCKRTPVKKKLFSAPGIFVLPKLLKIVFQNINQRNSLVNVKKLFQSWFFFIQQICFVFQKKILASFNHFFAFFVGLPVFGITDFINDLAESADNMKLIKDYRSLRAIFPDCFNVR